MEIKHKNKTLVSVFKYLLIWLFWMPTVAIAQSGTHVTLNGRTVAEQNEPIGFATVLVTLKTDTTKTYGAITDKDGCFAVSLPKDTYLLKVSFVGYNSLQREINLNTNTDLGALTMILHTMILDDVVVTAETIRREVDRFVVNVASTPLAAGKSSKEILAVSPGVWITDKGDISINGRGGTSVMIGDRLLRETGEELVSCLENIKAEDIVKIEVIPYAGAEYDANTTGGIIKITMRKQRESGFEGSFGMRYNTSVVDNSRQSVRPSINLNYKYNALSLYSKVNFMRNKWESGNIQEDQFTNRDRHVNSITNMSRKNTSTDGQLGAIYDINERQSIGAEFNVTGNPYSTATNGSSTVTENGKTILSKSGSSGEYDYLLLNAIATYTLKLDTVGSTFRAIAEYIHRNREDSIDFNMAYRGDMNDDTRTHYMPTTRYNIYVAQTDFNFMLSPDSKLLAGLKYTRKEMNNNSPYEYFQNGIWHPLPDRSSINQYDENIMAIYASFSKKFKNNISLLIDLRGEYTYSIPSVKSTAITDKQNYFDLFPNANLSIPLNEKQSQRIILSYGRKIGRPSFWQISPERQPISDYMFMEGNPKLKPSYTNDYSLSWVFANKYTFTLGVQQIKDAFGQIVGVDPLDADIMVARQSNLEKSTNYFLSLNIPARITNWWMLNTNLNGFNMSNTTLGVKQTQNTFQGNMSNVFTFCENYNLIVEAFYTSPSIAGNVKLGSLYMVNTGLKGNFLDKRLTATVYLNNITNKRGSSVSYNQDNVMTHFEQQNMCRTISLSITYSFRAGKRMKFKTVETSGEGKDNGRGGGF